MSRGGPGGLRGGLGRKNGYSRAGGFSRTNGSSRFQGVGGKGEKVSNTPPKGRRIPDCRDNSCTNDFGANKQAQAHMDMFTLRSVTSRTEIHCARC